MANQTTKTRLVSPSYEDVATLVEKITKGIVERIESLEGELELVKTENASLKDAINEILRTTSIDR